MTLSLQTRYFTQEMAGFEIESKWSLNSYAPVPTIIKLQEDINANKWHPYLQVKTMGVAPISLRYFQLEILFFGFQQNNNWQQIAMAAKFPGRDLYLVTYKDSSNYKAMPHRLYNPPLIRQESRRKVWLSYKQMLKQIQGKNPGAKYVGTLVREKCSIFLTNSQTFRNFTLSADLSTCNSAVLSQVEIEYKGRS